MTRESKWYDASINDDETRAFRASYDRLHAGTEDAGRDLHCLDLFSVSQNINKAFLKYEYKAEAYDIKLRGPEHDITPYMGFMNLLVLACRVRPRGLVAGGPPCSLFIFLSSSVHQRSQENLLGNQQNSKVRLANQIVRNTAYIIDFLLSRDVWCVLEQPAGSLMFKLDFMKAFIGKHCLTKVAALEIPGLPY